MHTMKFRAWHTVNNFWVNGLMIAASGKVYKLSAIQVSIHPFHGADKLLIQYCSGVSDETGNPIYEGDIVEVDGVIGVIKRSTYYCGFVVEYYKNGVPCYILGNLNRCKVKGNVCENPEMIPQREVEQHDCTGEDGDIGLS